MSKKYMNPRGKGVPMKYQLFGMLLIISVLSCEKTDEVHIKKEVPSTIIHHGKARIVSIIPTKDDKGTESQEFMDIYFDFISADKSGHIYTASKDKGILLEYDNRNSFHKNWIDKWGIKAGNEYPSVRYGTTGKTTGAHVYYEVELTPVQ